MEVAPGKLPGAISTHDDNHAAQDQEKAPTNKPQTKHVPGHLSTMSRDTKMAPGVSSESHFTW